MSKLLVPLVVAALAAAAGTSAPAAAAVLGPHAAECAGTAGKPAMLVRISGLKTRTGLIRVQSYGGNPATWFDKGTYLERVEIAPPASGPIDICMPVPRAGAYAVSVRHDVDGSRTSTFKDGGGFSGNPNLSLMDALFKRRPSTEQVEVRVKGVTRVPVVINYIQGGAVKPLASAAN